MNTLARLRFVIPAFILVAALLAGCASEPTSPSSSPAAPAEDPVARLREGMGPAEIVALMGEPSEKRKIDASGTIIEVWLYRRSAGARTEGIAPRVNEVPWIDPITGELKMLIEPAAGELRTEFVEELSLYLSNNQLAEVRRSVTQRRSFSP